DDPRAHPALLADPARARGSATSRRWLLEPRNRPGTDAFGSNREIAPRAHLRQVRRALSHLGCRSRPRAGCALALRASAHARLGIKMTLGSKFSKVNILLPEIRLDRI